MVDIQIFPDNTNNLIRNEFERCIKCETNCDLTNCQGCKKPCKLSSKGCNFIDINSKTVKHEDWYCEHSSVACWFCNRVPVASMASHWANVHLTTSRKVNTTWRHTRADHGTPRYVTSDLGVLVCMAWLRPSGFTFTVVSPLSSEQLRRYECVLVLQHPVTKQSGRFYLDACYDTEYDWKIEVTEGDVRPYVKGEEIDVIVNVRIKELNI